MCLMKQVKNIGLNAVGVTAEKNRNFGSFRYVFGTHIFLETYYETCTIKVENQYSTLFCAKVQ